MARRVTSGGWSLSNDVKGKSLRELISRGISLSFDCDQCGHNAVWPWPWMMREPKLQTLMGKMVHEFAPKLRCVNCGAKNFYMRPYMPRDAIKPTH